MTREEAIRHLYTYSTTMGSGQTSDEQHNEAKRMAIESLSAPSGDLISRADAIKTFIKWSQKEFGYSDINREERFIDAINSMETEEENDVK